MIATSDLVILAISGTLLATGIYRWQSNLQPATRQATIVEAPARNIPSSNPVNPASAVNARAAAQNSADLQRTSTVNAAPTDNFGSTAEGDISGTASSVSVLAAEETRPVASSETSTSASSNPAPLYGTYRVQPGDSLSLIADNHGTSIETLRTINSITGSLILVDQEILYPLPAN